MTEFNKPIFVLLVEDNFLNQKLICLNLAKYGFEIDIANNGKEALEKISQRHYDLVLMDLMMPVMDGLETTLEIRKRDVSLNIHTTIIGLTANTYDADRDKCLNHGMDEYMTKPFDLKEFFEKLKMLRILK